MIIWKGESIGVNLIFSNRNYYPMTTAAVTKAVILHIKKELVLELCHNNVNYMVHLMREISDRTIFLTDKIASISLKTIRQCIIDFLRYEYSLQKSNVIRMKLSKKALAERLGIQRSSLSRELNKMRKDGLLLYDAWSIT